MFQEFPFVLREYRHASITRVKGDEPTLLVTATAAYIPIDQFKKIFEEIGEVVRDLKIRKLIFDKRKLTVFHQPSMVWYFVEWKEEMFNAGLTRHVKILPQDEVFRQSVSIGRNKINEAYPQGKFHQLEIYYAESLDEAIAI